MNKFKAALAGLAAVGAAVVAAPDSAQAGGFGISFGFGHPGYHSYGYRPVSYGGWGHGYGYGYHRPYVRKVVVVHRPYRHYGYYRPYRPAYSHYGYYRPHRVRYISYGGGHYGHGYRHRYYGGW